MCTRSDAREPAIASVLRASPPSCERWPHQAARFNRTDPREGREVRDEPPKVAKMVAKGHLEWKLRVVLNVFFNNII